MGPEQSNSVKHEVGASMVYSPDSHKGDTDPSGIYEEITTMRHGIWPNNLSVAQLFAPTVGRAASLPVSPVAQEFTRYVCRSLSEPSHGKLSRSMGLGVFRVVPLSLRVVSPVETALNGVQRVENGMSSDIGEDVREEDAVCQICYGGLGEGGEAFKRECCCKGELALAHRECAEKWFSMKGSNICDVCKQEVRNLPVALTRLHNIQSGDTQASGSLWTVFSSHRNWHYVPILVVVSMLAYFCYLEQLLVADNGFAAIAMSLPFSCLLGFLSSLTSATMVRKGYIFVYAFVQFALVVVFTHMFYSLLHMQAVVSIMLATFAGFGAAMAASSVVVEYLRWRCRCGQGRRVTYSPDQSPGNVHQAGIPAGHINHRAG